MKSSSIKKFKILFQIVLFISGKNCLEQFSMGYLKQANVQTNKKITNTIQFSVKTFPIHIVNSIF
jgi:hypothetical protein